MVFSRVDKKDDMQAWIDLEEEAQRGVSQSELDELQKEVSEASSIEVDQRNIMQREFEIKKAQSSITDGSVKRNSFRRM
jgi:hypothetical protein